ncbi:hypothetical protein [Halopseudomonas salegens]|uniref:Uncharacterized protein n=1 Tax=Halopseudomonas salegens TaxID=1434072 RepID=A0A1H2FMC3_9GAMM|nr:hypothetical protein [Halopseudomonas salegens]SDU08118.1 hypothetical protein SAMN05216210_1643 [Halopseudomonas salegens]
MNDCKENSALTKVRKTKRKQPFDDNKMLMQFARLSSRKSIENLLASGISVVYMKDGDLVSQNPDHEITVIKPAENKEKFDLREYLCHG